VQQEAQGQEAVSPADDPRCPWQPPRGPTPQPVGIRQWVKLAWWIWKRLREPGAWRERSPISSPDDARLEIPPRQPGKHPGNPGQSGREAGDRAQGKV
jgi:hypothetical protein